MNPKKPLIVGLVGVPGNVSMALLRIWVKNGGPNSGIEIGCFITSGRLSPEELADFMTSDGVYGQFPVKITYNNESRPGSMGAIVFCFDKHTVSPDNTTIVPPYGNYSVPIFKGESIADLPLKELGITVVVEASGKNKSDKSCRPYLTAGAERVIITAPPKNEDGGKKVRLVVYGINDDSGPLEEIISAASCTTNAVIHIIKILLDKFGTSRILSGKLLTVHALTGSNKALDGGGERGVPCNIVAKSTGADKCVAELFPQLSNRFWAEARRVTTLNGSEAIMNWIISGKLTKDTINDTILSAINNNVKPNTLGRAQRKNFTALDVIGVPFGGVFDPDRTNTLYISESNCTVVTISSWYDNIGGYTISAIWNLLKKLAYAEQ